MTPGYFSRVVRGQGRRLRREARERLTQAYQFAIYGGFRAKVPKLPQLIRDWGLESEAAAARRPDWRATKALMGGVIAAQSAEKTRLAKRKAASRPPTIKRKER